MIRMSRVGKKKYPTYKILIQEKSKDPWGKALEILGNYNPHTKEFTCQADRIKYWLSVGAQMSPTVNNLLIRKEIIEGKKMKAAKLNKKNKKGETTKEEKPAEDQKETPVAEAPKEEKPAENKTEEIKPEVKEKKPVDKPIEEKSEKKEEVKEEVVSDK